MHRLLATLVLGLLACDAKEPTVEPDVACTPNLEPDGLYPGYDYAAHQPIVSQGAQLSGLQQGAAPFAGGQGDFRASAQFRDAIFAFAPKSTSLILKAAGAAVASGVQMSMRKCVIADASMGAPVNSMPAKTRLV